MAATDIINSTELLLNFTTTRETTDLSSDRAIYNTTSFPDGDFTHETYPIHEEYDEFIYPGYPFERPIYLFIWEILVIFVSIVNVLVIIVLTRKGMRNPTNMILTFIAVADSLTGLVTLPSYIMVYKQFLPEPEYSDYSHANVSYIPLEYNTYEYVHSPSYSSNYSYSGSQSYYSQEGYVLTKDLCRFFMISKFFLSKLFHTISIFLTLFLGFQRFVSVAFPFRAQSFFTMTKTVIVCVFIVVLSPLLHIYHLIKEKAIDGMCEWRIDDCTTDCAYLWFILFIRHLIPCFLLTLFTGLFLRELRRGRMEMNQEQSRRRAKENRRVTMIVVGIVVVFLVPEIPYGFFLLSSVIRKHSKIAFDLMTNRAIHAVYEITLVLSFHANFYIYTILNKRFRTGLKRTFVYPIRRAMGKPARWAISQSFSSKSGTNRKTMESSLATNVGTEMRLVPLNGENSRSTLDTKLVNGNSISDSK